MMPFSAHLTRVDVAAGALALALQWLFHKAIAEWRGVARAALLMGFCACGRGLAPVFGSDAVAPVVVVSVTVLSWKWFTLDLDVTRPPAPQVAARAVSLLVGCAGLAWPPLLGVWLALGVSRLRANSHHQLLVLRVVEAWLACRLVGSSLSSAGYAVSGGLSAVLVSSIHAVHYVRPGVGKLRLGAHWYDWVVQNRTEFLAASAHQWGWAAFIPPDNWGACVRLLARLRPALNAFAVATELLGAVALLHPAVHVAFLAAVFFMHAGIAICSGILFWESMLVAAALGLSLAVHVGAVACWGLDAWALSLGVIGLCMGASFPFRPSLLAWWDTPFTGRVRWEVEGRSGRIYTLGNDFMCPWERDYGRMHGFFLVPRGLIHYHLGTTTSAAVRNAVVACGGSAAEIEAIQRAHGAVHYDAAAREDEARFLGTMFAALNRGARKNVLPAALGWLKAPGGQMFYWGSAPRYRRQEPARRIRAYYTEKYFEVACWCSRTLRDEEVLSVLVEDERRDDGEAPPPPSRRRMGEVGPAFVTS